MQFGHRDQQCVHGRPRGHGPGVGEAAQFARAHARRALSLAVGVTALTLLIAVTLAFRGAVVGTLLGDVVTVQVRGVDYVAVAATVALGVLAVADALLISITERAPELATIRAFGWPEATSGGTEVTALHGGGLAAYRRTVGFVFQRYNLLPALTALDNVIAPVLADGYPADETIRRAGQLG